MPVRVQIAHGLGARLGDPEIGDLHPQPAETVLDEEDVRRLDVPVHQTRLVGCGQRVGDLPGYRHRLPRLQPALVPEHLAQCPAPDQLHDYVSGATVVAGVVGGDHGGMGQPGRGDRLPPEPLEKHLVRRQVGVQNLHRNRPAQHRVVAFPNLRHSPPGNRRDQPIPPAERATNGDRRGRIEARHDQRAYLG